MLDELYRHATYYVDMSLMYVNNRLFYDDLLSLFSLPSQTNIGTRGTIVTYVQ